MYKNAESEGVRREIRCHLARLSCLALLAASCAAPSEPEEAVGTQSSADTKIQINQDFKDLVDDAKQIGGYVTIAITAYETLQKVAQWTGAAATPPTVPDLIEQLRQRIDALAKQSDANARALDWKMTDLFATTTQWAPVSSALVEAHQRAEAGGPLLPRDSGWNINSATAVNAAGELVMFERLFTEASTDAGTWKSIITNNHPEILDDGQVFDWRLGMTWYTQLIAMRLLIMGAVDPDFVRNGSFNGEIDQIRQKLIARRDQMIRSIRCDWKDRNGLFSYQVPEGGFAQYYDYDHTELACVDVNTGQGYAELYILPNAQWCTNWIDNGNGPFPQTNPSCVANQDRTYINQRFDWMRRKILNSMPLFEVNGIIDELYRILHPERFDLTKNWTEEIPLEWAPNLCLDVIGGNTAVGSPVQVAPCAFNDAQWWQYDRPSGRLFNPPSGRCLEVKQTDSQSVGEPLRAVNGTFENTMIDNLGLGATAQLGDCGDPPPQRQKWSYDDEHKILRGGLNTVLDVQWGNLSAGVPVWLWDENFGGAQQWHADQPLGFGAAAPTDCSTLKPGEGLYAGQSLMSCDNRFKLSLESDGQLILYWCVAGGTVCTANWWAHTENLLGNMLIMQNDGNLVLYNGMENPVWSTNTAGHPGSVFWVQNDRNLVIYDPGGAPIWASNTCCE